MSGSTLDDDGAAEAIDPDEELPQLSNRQAQMLVESREVRAAIKDARLQELLRHIDSAPTREGALRRLERALADEEFEQKKAAQLKFYDDFALRHKTHVDKLSSSLITFREQQQ